MSSDINYDYVFKVVLLGSGGVGKTSLILRYIQDTFNEDYKPTLGTDFAVHVVSYKNNRICFQIWDLAGQEHFQQLRSLYCKGASAAVIVYDVTRPGTFMETKNWYDKFSKDSKTSYNNGHCSAVLIGNKIDLKESRLVPSEAGEMFKKWLDIEYIETSAKTGFNVDNLFIRLAESLMDLHT